MNTEGKILQELTLMIKRGISPAYVEEGVPVFNQKCIRGNKLDYSLIRHTDKGRKKISDEKYLKRWDVLVNSTGVGTLGRVAQFKDQDKIATVDSHVTIVRPDLDKIFGSYFGYCMYRMQPIIENMGAGATGQTELSRVRLGEDLEIPLPPLPTQQKIASILSAYDNLIENNTKRIQILEEMAQRIYKDWFVNFKYPGHENDKLVDSELGMIPEWWEVKKFGEIFEIKYGKGLPTKDIQKTGLYPVYGAGDVIGYYDRYVYENKIALITCRGNGSGTVWRTRETAFITNNSFLIVPKKEFEFLEYHLVEQFCNNINIKSVITGSAQPQITITNFSTIDCLLLPRNISLKYCKQFRSVSEQIDNLYGLNKILLQTRNLLLPKLISGKIDVSDLDIDTSILND